MKKTKFEQMLDSLISEDTARANELFHEIVVAKSRKIYEALVSQDFDPNESDSIGGDGTDDFESDVTDMDDDGMGDEGAIDDISDLGPNDAEEEFGDKTLDTRDLMNKLSDLDAKLDELLSMEENEAEGDEDEFNFDDEDEEGENDFPPAKNESYFREATDFYKEVGKKGIATKESGANTKSTVPSGTNPLGKRPVTNLTQGGTGPTHGTRGGLVKPTTTPLQTKGTAADGKLKPAPKPSTKSPAAPGGTKSLIGSKTVKRS